MKKVITIAIMALMFFATVAKADQPVPPKQNPNPYGPKKDLGSGD